MISSIFIYATALGIFFYVATILLSGLHSDSPFQTTGSALVRAICNRSTLTPGLVFGRISAIRWILDTSANPEVVEVAAAMIPRVQWPPGLDVSATYGHILDVFVTCVHGSELFMACGKALTHLRVHSLKTTAVDRREEKTWLSCVEYRSYFIRGAFMDARLACNQLGNTDDDGDRQRHITDVRTALRMMVVHGLTDRLSLPDDEELIWFGDLLWRHSDGRTPSCEEFDWLIEFLVDTLGGGRYPDTAGDALLALSAMRGLGSSTRRRRYVDMIIRCMDPDKPRRLRHTALRALSDAREDLSSITHDWMPQGVDTTLLDALSRAILGVAQDFQYDDDFQNRCYLRLISTLAKNDEWCKRLTGDRHLEWCNYLLDNVLGSPFDHNKTYLTMIFLRVDPSGKNSPATPQKRWRLIKRAWNIWGSYLSDDLDSVDIIDALPALVTATRQNVSDPNNDSMRAGLTRDVYRVLRWLEERAATADEAENLIDAALPVVQSFYNELSSYPITS
ncbi:hypothetical protein K503DRAFT_618456 [Rhizopogon vinicolor AM-OR11-026]|uniref:Uncharacterized protein n=1 Tax=Rhizopogon vinicolor AM-OR11-026 TaxID=1314800 RepID=A0A1B7MID6_9AGAM|nr:hypothetical protein K503DRAFT_618456 [Rhizopogon vinicolor AM-OR11-026]